MLASFLLALREGMEAALVLGIVLGVLSKLQRSDLNGQVWRGAGLASALSLLGAAGLTLLGMELKGLAEQLFEGLTLLLAAGVLTWMIVWMRRTSAGLKQEVEAQTRAAIDSNGLFGLAFLVVFREGIELALFLLAVGRTVNPGQTVLGTVFGLGSAAALGVMVFSSARSLNIRLFFNLTNAALLLFAAGMVGLGVHELNEAGVIPSIIENVWNINFVLSDKSEAGLLLKTLFGYNGNPSLTEILAYAGYIGIAGWFLARWKPQTSKTVA